MSPIDSIAVSGMQAAQSRLTVSANNVANAQTEGFRRKTVQQNQQAEGGVSVSVVEAAQPGPELETDLLDELQARNAFLANLAVFKTGNAVAGALLDTQA
jgi:flagellar basal body rod protein FlgC